MTSTSSGEVTTDELLSWLLTLFFIKFLVGRGLAFRDDFRSPLGTESDGRGLALGTESDESELRKIVR